MTKTIRILTLLALMVIGAGQAWAKTEPDLGKIVYTQTVNDHGTLSFYADEACQTAISNPDNGLNSSGLTPVKDGSDVIGYNVYIKATPDLEYTLGAADEGGKVTFIKAEVTVETNVAGARTRGTAPTVGVGDFIDVTATTTTGVYCMTMPADKNLNLLVTATFVVKPMNTAAISYIDADGVTQTKDAGTVYILDGSETVLGKVGVETWYVCNTAATANSGKGLSYTSTLQLNGDVHLILADNAKMSVDANNDAIFAPPPSNFYIYGQSDDDNSGKLIATSSSGTGITIIGKLYVNGGQVTATGTSGNGIICNSVGSSITISGGQVEATGSDNGIDARNITVSDGQVTATGTTGFDIIGNITVSGGQVTATGSTGFDITGNITVSGGQVTATGTNGDGIFRAGQGSVTITGGQVTATGSGSHYGIYDAIGDITLGWTDPSDYIKVSSYFIYPSKSVKTTEGQRFVAYNMANESDISATAIVSDTYYTRSSDVDTDDKLKAALADINGKTLKPLVGYTVTAADDITLMDGTTAKTPDFTIGETSYYKYSENASVTLTATDSENRMLSSVTLLSDGSVVLPTDNGDNTFTFTMGTSDVTVTAATFLEKVSYIDPTATGDDKIKTVFATPLTGNETVLGTDDDTPTWYVVNGDVNFDHALEINKDVCIILANEKTMNIGSETSGLESYGIAIRYGSQLTIYGQGGATEGSLNIYSNELSPSIYSTTSNTTITICGGHVVTSRNIYLAYGTVNILGGTFTDEQAFSESAIPYSIQASEITINGGAVSANGLLFAETNGITVNGGSIDVYQLVAQKGDITLGWTNAETDYIKTTNGYQCNDNDGNLTFATGKRFYAYDGENVAAVYDAQTVPTKDDNKTYPDLAGKTLKPCTDISVTITKDANGYSVSLTEGGEGTNPLPISGNVKDLDYSRPLTPPTSDTYDYMIDGTTPANLFTVCLPFAPTTDDGVKYYTLNSVSGTTLNFKEVTTAPAAFTPYMVAVTGNSTVTESCNDVEFETSHAINSTPVQTDAGNFTFTGTLTGLNNTAAANAAGTGNVTYILQHQAKWGKVVSGNNNVKIPPFRAYITGPDVTTTSGARELNSSFGDDATGIDTLRLTDSDGTEHWYDLNGRRIDKPTRKGVFIHGGRKEVIR